MNRLVAFAAVGVVALAMSSCQQKEIDRLNAKIDSLNEAGTVKDENLSIMVRTMGEVQDNINAIKEKEGIVVADLSEGASQSQIQKDLDAIYSLMVENKEKLRIAQARLNQSNAKNKELESMIVLLQGQITAQNEEIKKLQEALASKNIEIDFLNNAVVKLTASVDSISSVQAATANALGEATDELQTGFYVVGSKKDLLAKGVITSAGLFAGKKSSADINESLFTKVNVKELERVELNGKKAKVVSQHPESSYEIVEEGESEVLVIKDKEAFWKGTRYLVVTVK